MNHQYSATSKYIRLSPHKVRRVLSQIRGKSYSEALMILTFMPYKPCLTIKKILQSAAHNATNNNQKNRKQLIINEAFANSGPKLKRFQPRAQGRAFKIQKPTCHITLRLMFQNKSI
uniref:Large ribosomal subunit protein uL22c n=1 Tax=Porolithon onkodes TaxID=231751 RepID=A0A2Z2L3D7_9FLOR|nr:ribosomal protein L22 [Porolithon onkodes]ASB29713.1 ribosomal protein L22 [Porolithon onkodes]